MLRAMVVCALNAAAAGSTLVPAPPTTCPAALARTSGNVLCVSAIASVGNFFMMLDQALRIAEALDAFVELDVHNAYAAYAFPWLTTMMDERRRAPTLRISNCTSAHSLADAAEAAGRHVWRFSQANDSVQEGWLALDGHGAARVEAALDAFETGLRSHSPDVREASTYLTPRTLLSTLSAIPRHCFSSRAAETDGGRVFGRARVCGPLYYSPGGPGALQLLDFALTPSAFPADQITTKQRSACALNAAFERTYTATGLMAQLLRRVPTTADGRRRYTAVHIRTQAGDATVYHARCS